MKKFLYLLIFFASTILASTVYISHSPSVIMRDGPNPNANVLKQLPNGAALELLKTNLQNGYSYVRTDKHEMGWVRTEFLTDTHHIARPGFFKRIWYSLKTRLAQFKSRPKPKAAVKPPSIHHLVSSNRAMLLDLQQEVQQLKAKMHSRKYWFFSGTIIILIGVLIGFGFGRRQKRRDNWH